MKTSSDPRHKRRRELLRLLFAGSFTHQRSSNAIFKHILENQKVIDTIISKIAPEYPVDKINKVDLAILRLAVFELEIEKKQPPKVIVDEAIELAKEFGGDSSPSFINGALANLVKHINT
jgi:N utilization substance protein B